MSPPRCFNRFLSGEKNMNVRFQWTFHLALLGSCLALTVLVSSALAAGKQNLTDPASYATVQEKLATSIASDLPTIDDAKKSEFGQAIAEERAAKKEVDDAKKALKELGNATGLLNHRKGWISRATKGVAEAKEKLKQAKASGDAKAIAEAEKGLADITENYNNAASELAKSENAVAEAKKLEPQAKRRVEQAEQAYEKALARAMQNLKSMRIDKVLASDELDGKLAMYVIIKEATPEGLASFAGQSPTNEQLLEKLLKDSQLMVQMLVADGARDGKYGEAMTIYEKIQQASDKASEGVLQRLALAISLQHAVPMEQRNAVADVSAPKTVDPVRRYLSYEQAYLAGELDPMFDEQSVWNLRMVVDGEEPDEISAWGRQMLKNYRPDHVTESDYKWRYVGLVRTDIPYGSQNVKFDKPELQFFQNILMNGGICGRRAFIGRFMLRAFGVPTTARPQPGHAALTHWTPDGWVVCLGAGWGQGRTKGIYNSDLNFLATTQARQNATDYMMVKRAQWLGDLAGEPRVYGFISKQDPGFWYGASLYVQRDIIEQAKAVALAPVGEDIAEASDTRIQEPVLRVDIDHSEREISVDSAGVISIPAAATSKPTNNTRKIKFMDSVLGGKQLHYDRRGGDEEFVYTFQAPQAGSYQLTARVVTPTWKQHLTVQANGSGGPVTIPLPHTVGLWDETEPIEVNLASGENTLRFTADANGKGLTIKDFKLMPVK